MAFERAGVGMIYRRSGDIFFPSILFLARFVGKSVSLCVLTLQGLWGFGWLQGFPKRSEEGKARLRKASRWGERGGRRSGGKEGGTRGGRTRVYKCTITSSFFFIYLWFVRNLDGRNGWTAYCVIASSTPSFCGRCSRLAIVAATHARRDHSLPYHCGGCCYGLLLTSEEVVPQLRHLVPTGLWVPVCWRTYCTCYTHVSHANTLANTLTSIHPRTRVHIHINTNTSLNVNVSRQTHS